MDGKQARRTGSANPLGELFDHGCDSLSTVFVALSACIAVQLGHHSEWMFFQVNIATFNKNNALMFDFVVIFSVFVR